MSFCLKSSHKNDFVKFFNFVEITRLNRLPFNTINQAQIYDTHCCVGAERKRKNELKSEMKDQPCFENFLLFVGYFDEF